VKTNFKDKLNIIKAERSEINLNERQEKNIYIVDPDILSRNKSLEEGKSVLLAQLTQLKSTLESETIKHNETVKKLNDTEENNLTLE
jgi:hypothetical protein